jgi:hypothetical protein
VTWQTGNYREARITYDSKGQVSRFSYDEQPLIETGRVRRLLTVDYGDSPDGRVVSRNGTVSTSGGPAVAISNDDTDKWLDNYEAGIDPVGPPAARLGWLRSIASDSSSITSAVCVDCAFIQARLAWPVFLHDLYFNAQTGKPIEGDPVEIQVAAQNQSLRDCTTQTSPSMMRSRSCRRTAHQRFFPLSDGEWQTSSMSSLRKQSFLFADNTRT